MELPEGLHPRPHTENDAQAVYELVAAAETYDTGEAAIDLADVQADWGRPSFDLATESIGIWDGDRLAAAGEVFAGRRAEGIVHPDYRGRGLGSWLERCARAQGSRLVGQSVPAGSSGEQLLQGRGYRLIWTSWVLQLPADAEIAASSLPSGYWLREYAGEADGPIAHRLIDDAFGEWPDREPTSYADWAAGGPLRPGFEPWQLRFVVDPEGTEVAACYVVPSGIYGYVDQVAVRRDQRGKGLARRLLADAFARARAHGATIGELATDSRTGALGLYQHVGMEVTQTWRHWATEP